LKFFGQAAFFSMGCPSPVFFFLAIKNLLSVRYDRLLLENKPKNILNDVSYSTSPHQSILILFIFIKCFYKL